MTLSSKSNEQILIADVIPAAKLPKEISQFFSYAVPIEMESLAEEGAIVEVPFRNKSISGVVLRLHKANESEFKYKLKRISRVFENGFVLSGQVLELAKFASEYYYSPLSLVIKTIIPNITKKSSRKKIDLNERINSENISTDLAESVLNNLKKKNLLLHNSGAERHALYASIMKKLVPESGEILLLLPEYFDVYNFAFIYISGLGLNRDEVAILTGDMTDNQYFEEWNKISKGSAKLVIGTRNAVFAPFQNLKLIIVDSEHSSSFKQWDMNPRYNAVTLADKLSEIWDSTIIFSSPAPTIERFYKAENEGYSMINIVKKDEEKNFDIIDIDLERKKGNYSALSEKLKSELLNSIYKKNQALIFIPRLGINTITKCKDCEFMAHCEDCSGLLTSFKDSLYCTRCRKKFDLIKKCPKCGGQNISSFGYGVEKIEEELKNLFVNKNIKIARLDSTSAENKSKQHKISKDFINGKIDIVIGTQMAIKNWNMPCLAVIGVLFPEIIFNQPDFRSRERSFQFLMSLKNEGSTSRKIIIETYDVKNPIFKTALTKNFAQFYKEELSFRKSISKIGYPPFSRLIKLIYKSGDKEKCRYESQKMYSHLSKIIISERSLSDSFEIIRPFPAQSFREHGKYRYYIVIKCASSDFKKRDLILNEAKKDWIIDVDPDSLL